ncbi:MAG: DUF1501 domain-containing protein [Planctomycetes bacterium]|nr:DUF1501 domain-containing protein [Planctomycetota bacterium]
MNNFFFDYVQSIRRREFLRNSGLGIGAIALASLLSEETAKADRSVAKPQAGNRKPHNPLAPKRTHFPAQAKSIIYLHMVGAPSQLDLFDYKPILQEHTGKECPKELVEGERFAFLPKNPKLLGTSFKFSKHGESGQEFSELLPHLSQHADDIAVVKSLHTEEFNHGPAQIFIMTGFGRQGRPSIGSWLTYGLGSESRDLPAFVVLVTGLTGGGGSSMWGPGFLPSVYQGVRFRTKGEPVLFVTNPEGIDRAARGRIVDDIRKLNELQLKEIGDPEIATRIASYELAYRMQSSVPELMDIKGEPKHIHDLYGTQPGKASFANNCLLARRLIERGVRIVQLFDQGWDHHGGIAKRLPVKCKQTDQPIAALITDLKQRGMLDETLIVWGGEFGRTPMLQGDRAEGAGRDHHKDALTMWLAGGGVKGGVTVGKTDDLGYHIVEDKMHMNDMHATILHLMGLDHLRLTHRFQGRDYRLTDVGGIVMQKLLA